MSNERVRLFHPPPCRSPGRVVFMYVLCGLIFTAVVSVLVFSPWTLHIHDDRGRTLVEIDDYLAATDAVLADPEFDDVGRAEALVGLVNRSRAAGLLPLPGPAGEGGWPSRAEIEAVVLLQSPAVAGTFAPEIRQDLEAYMTETYPRFRLADEVRFRERKSSGGTKDPRGERKCHWVRNIVKPLGQPSRRLVTIISVRHEALRLLAALVALEMIHALREAGVEGEKKDEADAVLRELVTFARGLLANDTPAGSPATAPATLPADASDAPFIAAAERELDRLNVPHADRRPVVTRESGLVVVTYPLPADPPRLGGDWILKFDAATGDLTDVKIWR